MRNWALAFYLVLLCFSAEAKVHRGRPRTDKIFAANPQSVILENQAADEMGAIRYFTQAQVDKAALDGTLAPLYNHMQYLVASKLPIERRYALPATVSFVELLALDFYRTFHQPLTVDSAVRPATTQKKLARYNRNAAPAYGSKVSSHEFATTIDVSKRLTRTQQQWLVIRLLYYRALGRVLVIQERGCLHIFVKGESSEVS